MDLELEPLKVTLCKGIRMIVAVRALAKDVGLDVEQLADLEREVREVAGMVQNCMYELKTAGKPLVLKY